MDFKLNNRIMIRPGIRKSIPKEISANKLAKSISVAKAPQIIIKEKKIAGRPIIQPITDRINLTIG